jgi:hypothetical protein
MVRNIAAQSLGEKVMKGSAFEVGDRVLDAERERYGTVIKAYLLGGVYRYLVRFDDGTEQGFYGFELEFNKDQA